MRTVSKLLLTFISLFICHQSYADYILTAPPRENPDKGEALYGPIAEKLSAVLNEPVRYEQASSWADYAKQMRKGRYDIVFDGPHFVGWRQRHLEHTPVAQLPGSLEFYVVTNKDSVSIKNKRDLIGKKICGFPSPHLGTGLVYDIFENPVLQPTIYEVKGGQKNALIAFKQGHCDATIFRTSLFKKLPKKERDTLKIVATTKSLPNQTFSISKRLSKKRKEIEKFLHSKAGASAADGLLSRYSKNAKYFTKPNVNNYSAAADVLEGVVWGW